ncbi:ABC transporter permease subunit [Xenophilus azovorans]|uniref:branched-chain amino acid ABC transporter ATP-binding protein/permease n=1 Tax=Xenophilus azovorans TaxID=151755 RepID=UPI00057161B9|nr:branched-chain amino acid ABC transporter ATP-binding protein/permease [Xenophilus azovorans]
MDYLLHICVMVTIYVILASSLNLLIGYAGLFALSHAAFYALGGYVTAILTTRYGLPFPLPLMAAAGIGGLVGAAVALPAMRVAGFYLVIVSLALHVLVLSVIENAKPLTGGVEGINNIPRIVLGAWRVDSAARMLPLSTVLAVLSLSVAWRVAHSPFGRALKAMRENEQAAQAIGKNIVGLKMRTFAVASALAAAGGYLFAHYVTLVNPASFGIDVVNAILAMMIFGGSGNLAGSVVGAAVLVVLPELLKFVELPVDPDKSRQVIYGLLLILVMRYRPEGLLPERTSAHSGRHRDAPAAQGSVPAAPAATLQGRGLVKRFGGITAVDGIDIVLPPGRITGIIGPNGAGKTTAFNLLTGFLQPTAGVVTIDGRPLAGMKPHQIVQQGIARSFQDLKLFPRMTVLEHVVVALPRQAGDRLRAVFFRPAAVAREERANHARALAILDYVGLRGMADELAINLSYAEEKLLSVARLLATGAGVLLFDEPLSGLDGRAMDEVMPLLRRLADEGRTVCIIEHNLDVIKGLCSHAYFFDEGRAMAQGEPGELLRNPVLAERYFR